MHSPVRNGFWWSHVGWILAEDWEETQYDRIPDMARYPELRWLNEHYLVPPVALAVLLLPESAGCRGWCGASSSAPPLLWHATFTINSLSHVFGSRRYETGDASRNNVWLALLTMGEGWHNNHHRYMNSVRQGFFWWEVDASYYILKALSWLGLVWDLHQPPARLLLPEAQDAGRVRAEAA